jgi:hypothetical protein
VEEASTGLFPTLASLFQPQVEQEQPWYFIGILAFLWSGALLVWAAPSAKRLFVVILLLMLQFIIFFSSFELASGQSAGSAGPQAASVTILDRKLAGAFDTTTIASRDPGALRGWLIEHGFAVSTNSEPVIGSYVADGWVFVAARLRRESAAGQTNTAHPLSFTFKTERPVYPVRLTGVENGPVSVELYVFGPARASARHFRTERCTFPGYPALSPEDPTRWREHWPRFQPKTLQIVHPLLRKWLAGSPVATKLSAHLSPSDMRDDVHLDWISFAEKGGLVYSPEGARTLALNLGAGVLAVVLVGTWLLARARRPGGNYSARWPIAALLIGLLTGLSVYALLPKAQVRFMLWPYASAEQQLELLRDVFSQSRTPSSKDEVRELIKFWRENSRSKDNILLGGEIHEEDSPGNFVLKDKGNSLELVFFDPQGAEHVADVWPLKAEPGAK